jgi:hypothetical protein
MLANRNRQREPAATEDQGRIQSQSQSRGERGRNGLTSLHHQIPVDHEQLMRQHVRPGHFTCSGMPSRCWMPSYSGFVVPHVGGDGDLQWMPVYTHNVPSASPSSGTVQTYPSPRTRRQLLPGGLVVVRLAELEVWVCGFDLFVDALWGWLGLRPVERGARLGCVPGYGR